MERVDTVKTCNWSEAKSVRRHSHHVEIAAVQRRVENIEQQQTIVVVDGAEV